MTVPSPSLHAAIDDIWWMARREGERLDVAEARTLDEAFAAAIAHGVVLRQGNTTEALWAAHEVVAPADLSLTEAAATIALHARRYAHGRATYAASMYNRAVLAMSDEVDFAANLAADGTLFAADGMGSAFDGVTASQRATTVAAHMPATSEVSSGTT